MSECSWVGNNIIIIIIYMYSVMVGHYRQKWTAMIHRVMFTAFPLIARTRYIRYILLVLYNVCYIVMSGV